MITRRVSLIRKDYFQWKKIIVLNEIGVKWENKSSIQNLADFFLQNGATHILSGTTVILLTSVKYC